MSSTTITPSTGGGHQRCRVADDFTEPFSGNAGCAPEAVVPDLAANPGTVLGICMCGGVSAQRLCVSSVARLVLSVLSQMQSWAETQQTLCLTAGHHSHLEIGC